MRQMIIKKIITQFLGNSKSIEPVTEDHQLRTVYKMEFEDGDGDGYYSDCMANSEGTYQFNVNSSMYNTTADDDSNGESVLKEMIWMSMRQQQRNQGQRVS